MMMSLCCIACAITVVQKFFVPQVKNDILYIALRKNHLKVAGVTNNYLKGAQLSKLDASFVGVHFI